MRALTFLPLVALFACEPSTVVSDDTDGDPDTDVGSDPFADRVVGAPIYGEAAGFGQDALPDIVLGPPVGKGALAGGTDVLALGVGGSIVLGLDLPGLADGPGVDLLVFENGFPGWVDWGVVAVSDDGVTWHEWPCDPEAEGATGCAGSAPVLSNPTNGVDPTDPAVAGGDAYDLAELALPDGFVASFVRVTDAGFGEPCVVAPCNTGGFDLDAIAVVNPGP